MAASSSSKGRSSRCSASPPQTPTSSPRRSRSTSPTIQATYTVSATAPATLLIYVYGTATFNPLTTLDPTTVVVNGVAFPNATIAATVPPDLNGDGFQDAVITITPRSALNLLSTTTTLTVTAKTLAASLFAGQTYSSSAAITVTGGSTGGGGGGGGTAASAPPIGSFVPTSFLAHFGPDIFVPSYATLSQLNTYKPIPVHVALQGYLPSAGFAQRLYYYAAPGQEADAPVRQQLPRRDRQRRQEHAPRRRLHAGPLQEGQDDRVHPQEARRPGQPPARAARRARSPGSRASRPMRRRPRSRARWSSRTSTRRSSAGDPESRRRRPATRFGRRASFFSRGGYVTPGRRPTPARRHRRAPSRWPANFEGSHKGDRATRSRRPARIAERRGRSFASPAAISTYSGRSRAMVSVKPDVRQVAQRVPPRERLAGTGDDRHSHPEGLAGRQAP